LVGPNDKDESTETGFTNARHIGVSLTDSNFDSADVILTVGDNIQGTAMADTFTANEDVIGAADKLDGGGGNDTLSLTGGGSFYLHTMRNLMRVETLEGSSASDHIWITREQLEDLRQIDGKGRGAAGDELSIFGTMIDLTGKTISGFDIYLKSDDAEIAVDDFDLAQHVHGYDSANDKLILKTGTISDDERLILHRNGIETIVTLEDDHETTHDAPELTAFAEGAVSAERGKLTFLDTGRNAGLNADEGLLKSLYVYVYGSLDLREQLGIDASNGVSLVDAASS
jgi:hypothetical protein